MHKIINSGGWFVGGGAVIDWLSDFDETIILSGDFNILRLENGIMDIISENDLNKKIDILNCLKKEVLYGFYKVSKSFVGKYTKYLLSTKKQKKYNGTILFYRILLKNLNEYELLLKNNKEINEIFFWKDWLIQMEKAHQVSDKQRIVTYQNPFFYDETFDGHKSIWPSLFDNAKFFFIHREPLDQFADIINKNDHLNTLWPRFHGNSINMKPAERLYYISKKLYNARIRMAQKYDISQLIIFSFEDFIIHHQIMEASLKSFFDISSNPIVNKKKFDSKKSLKNIGIGKDNDSVMKVFYKKEYFLDELNLLRKKLENCKQSISPLSLEN